MATQERIATELARMSVVYRQPLSETELEALTYTWADLVDDISDEDFIAACKAHLRTSRFFPCPADIRSAHEALTAYAFSCPALPEMCPDQESEELHNAVSAAMCRLAMHDDLAKEFFQLTDWVDKEAFARKMLGKGFPERPYMRRKVASKAASVADLLGAPTVPQ